MGDAEPPLIGGSVQGIVGGHLDGCERLLEPLLSAAIQLWRQRQRAPRLRRAEEELHAVLQCLFARQESHESLGAFFLLWRDPVRTQYTDRLLGNSRRIGIDDREARMRIYQRQGAALVGRDKVAAGRIVGEGTGQRRGALLGRGIV